MFDLNLEISCNDQTMIGECYGEEESPATSNSFSNDETCSIRASSGTGDASLMFNFGILNGNDRDDKDHDPGLTSTETETEMVTRQLFPTSQLGELKNSSHASLSLSFDQDQGHLLEESQPEILVQQPQHDIQRVQAKKSRRGPKSKSSQYRGVTFYRRTGRWESHIWDCGKQVYLGGFDTALSAARAYDRAAIQFRGIDADINFNLSDYEEDMKEMKNLSKEEFIRRLRRQSNGFSRGSSRYRGVTLYKCGRWEAQLGQFLGKKTYDKAAAGSNGRDAVTNFNLSTYDGKNPHNGGSPHDLDLNLGISTSSLKECGNLFSSQFLPRYMQNTGQPKEQEVTSSKGQEEWARRVYSNPLAVRIAASSGFVFPTTTTTTTTTFSASFSDPSLHNLRFAPTSTNTSHKYLSAIPSLPPP